MEHSSTNIVFLEQQIQHLQVEADLEQSSLVLDFFNLTEENVSIVKLDQV